MAVESDAVPETDNLEADTETLATILFFLLEF